MPVNLSEKVTVLFTSEDLSFFSAVCWIKNVSLGHVIRSSALNFWKTGGTEYHLNPKTPRKEQPPALNDTMIEWLKKINEDNGGTEHIKNLQLELRIRLGLRQEFIFGKTGREGAARILNEMKPSVGMTWKQEE